MARKGLYLFTSLCSLRYLQPTRVSDAVESHCALRTMRTRFCREIALVADISGESWCGDSRDGQHRTVQSAANPACA